MELVVLRELVRRRDYVGGSELAETLGVSKPTVHRVIEELRRKGYIIESHPRRGYRLVLEEDLSRAQEVLSRLPGPLKYVVHYVRECTSTQDVGEALARSGAPEGTVVVAEKQLAGRGRMGRKWESGKGGLWMTIVLRPRMIIGLQLLSLAAGVAVTRAVNELYGLNAGIKWPNDVLVSNRKLAGILVEGTLEADEIKYVLVGIGINVNNELPENLRETAVALKQLFGHPLPRTPLLRSMLAEFSKEYNKLLKGETRTLLKDWRSLSITLGKRVEVKTPWGITRGIARDIDEDGALIIVSDNGKKVRVHAGDCSLTSPP